MLLNLGVTTGKIGSRLGCHGYFGACTNVKTLKRKKEQLQTSLTKSTKALTTDSFTAQLLSGSKQTFKVKYSQVKITVETDMPLT